MDHSFLNSAPVLDLLGLYSAIIDELRKRGVLRTVNNPVADYAEFLACHALSLTPAGKSEKGFDATDQKGKKYEIKARRIAKGSKPTRFSAIRKLNEKHFDYFIAVLFTNDFRVQKATLLPWEFVIKTAFYQEHVNAHILPINDSIWNAPGAKDITKPLQELQAKIAANVSQKIE